MRSKKAFINIVIGMLSYLVLMLSNFITRSFLVHLLGNEVVGLETTFRNIISMLSLAELGIGTGLVYKLYKPIAENDYPAIKRILNFYTHAYRLIAGVILAVGLVLSFFVHFLVKEAYSPAYLGLVFFLFLLDTVASYLYANRKALMIADQRSYLVNINDAIVQFLSMIVQVTVLLWVKSFIVYIVIKILCRLMGAFLIARRFRKWYPQIAADRSRDMLPADERRSLMQNIGAMLFHKIGGFSVTATGSTIITYFVGLNASGVYGNYTLVTATLTQVLAQIFNGITASFGSLMTEGSEKTVYQKFNQLYFLNFWIYSFCSICLLVLIQPFITLMAGESSLLDRPTVVLLVTYFYVNGIRRVILMARDSAGLYRPDRYLALTEAALNVVLSIVLVKLWGVAGVILANTLSMLLIPLWSQPYLVYKYILRHSLGIYYGKYILYFGVTAAAAGLTAFLASWITVDAVLFELLLKGLVCLIVPNALFLLLFHRTAEFRALWTTGRQVLKTFRRAK